MPRKDGDMSEDKLTRHGAPIRTIEDIYRRVFAPRQKPHPAPPVAIDDPDAICVIVNVKWVSHLIGVIDVLADEDMWTGDDTERHRASTEIQRLIQHLMTGEACMVDPCCPETNELLTAIVNLNTTIITNQTTIIDHEETQIEQNNTTIIANYLNSYYQHINVNNQMQITNTYIYDGTPQSIDDDIPDEPLATGEVGKDALCWACSKYLESMIYNIQMSLVITAATASAATAVAAIAAGIVLAPVTGGASIVAGLVAGAGIVGGAAVGVLNSILNNSEAQRKVVCCMYESLKDLELTEANFKTIASDCGDMDDDENAQLLASWVNEISQRDGSYLAFLRLIGEAQGQGDWLDCDCCKVIEEYDIVAINDCTVTKLTDYTYRIQQTNFTTGESDPFCTDYRVFTAQFAESQGRCIDIIGGSGTALNRYRQLDCSGNEVSGVGGGGGSGTFFEWVSRACPPDPTTMDIVITIACPTLTFVPVL